MEKENNVVHKRVCLGSNNFLSPIDKQYFTKRTNQLLLNYKISLYDIVYINFQ